MAGESIRVTTPTGPNLLAAPAFKDVIVFPRFPPEILGALGITVSSTCMPLA